uniref:Guanylate cyclase n=1 Tax=Panagrellus redivivus TaxID=6233 RepID=A0A7E4V748_PANRE
MTVASWDVKRFDMPFAKSVFKLSSRISPPAIMALLRSIFLFLLLFVGAQSVTRDSRQAEVDTVAASDLPSNLSTGLQREITADENGNVVIRIGHIGAIGMLPNDNKILDISRQELIESGVLQKGFNFEIVSRSGCGDSFQGVAVAAQMYHTEKIRAFLGPYCNAELDAVAKMSSFWNIPVISYMATTSALQDRTIYKTLARISSKNTNSIAKATVKLISHYGWRRIAIATNTGATAYERVQAFEDELRRASIAVVTKIMLEEGWNATEIVHSGMLSELQNNARIVVCVFSSTREMTREFMQATFKANVNNAEYAYILPWLQSGPKDASPWVGSSGEVLQQVKDHYANAIIVDDVNGFDDAIVENFIQKIGNFGLSRDDIDVANIFGYLHLYDALKLYALAASKAFKNSGNDMASLTDGRLIWSHMRRMKFEGVGSAGDTGTVLMDDLADRAPVFAAFFIAPNREKVMKMVNMESVPIANCDSSNNKTGCFDLKLTDIMTGFWPSDNGSMPVDEPVCGFRGQKCSYTLEIAIGAAVLLFIILLFASYFIYRFCQSRSLDKMPWRVFQDDLRMIDDAQARSLLSLGSANTKLSNMSTGNKRHAIIGVNTHSTYHKYSQRRPIKFCRADLMLLSQMKAAIHDNINPFLGISFNEKEDLLVLWKFCSRGTVQDIIYNKNMTLDEKFHGAFVRDITLGLEYLHLSQIGYHGSLSPWACVIDRNWSVRLTDFGIYNALERWEKEGAISIENVQGDDDKSQASQRTSALYQPPEQLKNRESNRSRRMDQKWVAQSQARRQAADIYAFGMVMYEILYRSLPYPEGTDIGALVDSVVDGSRHVRPQIQDRSKVHPDIFALLMDCWSENPEVRPSIRRVRLNTEMALKTKGSLVDQMMRVMEVYANNLEKLVQERTGMLEEANLKAERLLNQLLPKYIANELKLGRPVAPKLFSSATVLFSDIVGFTRLCADSSPLEVVNMLNGIYTGFDERIAKHGAYKVETIGDAYMVVSGIPEENGINHVKHIANIALNMRTFLLSFEVPHRKNERIKCRWGFHTGAVAAGVVGLTAPRYCLFGDTVNTASRMESTGLPEMIQISQQSYQVLSSSFPEFKCKKRGEVEIKGKGLCITYWLDDKVSMDDLAASQQNFDALF